MDQLPETRFADSCGLSIVYQVVGDGPIDLVSVPGFNVEVRNHGGILVKSTGDGILARFDGPSRAVACAHALRERAVEMGLATRAGAHTGEIELRGADVRGIAVHIASRVASLADAGEVLVSRTVKDLAVGSGIVLEDRGEHDLKGVPDPWSLFAASV